MPRHLTWSLWASLALAILVAVMPAAQAQDFSAADKATMKAYVLDTAKVTRYIAGLNALAMAKNSDDAIADEYEKMDAEPGESLAELKAKLSRHPRLFAFFQRQNLTPDDVILIPFVLINAGVAVAVPGQLADVVTSAQLNFVRGNAALMQRLTEANDALENPN